MRRLSLNRSEPAKKSGQNIPKNRCRTTIPERMGETRAELPFIGDQVVCLSHHQAARSGPSAMGNPASGLRDGGCPTVAASACCRRELGRTGAVGKHRDGPVLRARQRR